ncbi:hypothetical protein PEP31012_01796 [Pandoraea eparura]|uniref:Uncharacterized protein n=1 Tax=Pandoraea eparura TaxID=2508291 RepID=A0A5E4U5L0_9BURK|nr:hypothetical protein PEP31012_01796 [Pandoraea eparura]
MIIRANHNQLVRVKWHNSQTVRRCTVSQHANVGHAFYQSTYDIATELLLNVNLDFWMLPHKGRQHLWQAFN